MKRRGPLFFLALAALVIVPGALLVLAWSKRGAIVSAIGYAVRSAYSGNFGGKRTVAVDQVVIHTTEASAESALSWFAMPHGAAGPTSAHYVVGKAGAVTQAVPEDRIAWHAGERTVNGRSIGIECEGWAAKPETWTPELLDALVALTANLCARHSIPVRRFGWTEPGIIGHADVAAVAAIRSDPGPHFPWRDFLARVDARSQGVA